MIMADPSNTYLQAESELSDEKRREEIDAVVLQARSLVLKSHNLSPSIDDDDPKVKELLPPFKTQLRAKSKELLIEEEVNGTVTMRF